MQVGWNRVKHNIPVDTFDKKTLNTAWNTQHQLNRINIKGKPYDAFNELIELDEDLTNFVSDILGQVLSVKQQAADSDFDEDISTDLYRIMEINLRYYRSQNIDNKIEQGMNQDKPGRNNINRTLVTRLKVNQEKLLERIKKSMHQANQKFRSIDGYDDSTVYLLLLAERFESNIRYFGQYAQESKQGTEVIDFQNMVSGGQGEISEEDIQDIVSEKQEMENKIEEADKDLDEIQ